MDLEIQSYGAAELFADRLPECRYFSYIPDDKLASDDDDDDDDHFDFTEAESLLIDSVVRDDKTQLVAHAKRFVGAAGEALERSTAAKLLHLCCNFDSPDCSTALLGGELGTAAAVNEIDDSGKSPLHTAALAHSARCVEVLLKRHARTGLRTRDGRGQLALDLSLSSTRMDVVWNPEDHTVEDLVVVLGEKDLTTVRLLGQQTKEIGDVAYANAVEGRIVNLAALLIVAAEKVNESVLELRDKVLGSKEQGTVYECLIRRALSLSRPKPPSRAAKHAVIAGGGDDNLEKRKILLLELELLQLFGAVAQSGCTDKKVTPPLIRAAQVGDEAVIELLLQTNIDVNEADADGNSALHWFLKLSRLSCPQQIKIVWLLLKHGARVSQRNKLGVTAFHIAACNGHSEALQILLLKDPDGIQYKTEIQETPLFFAVKNGSMECVEILLSWGANSEVLNLRKLNPHTVMLTFISTCLQNFDFNSRQRPVDLTTSQDMRFMLLNPTSVTLSKKASLNQHKCISCSKGHGSFSSPCEEIAMTDEDTTAESTKEEVCKYFDSPRGCVRGATCFYAHGLEEQQKAKEAKAKKAAVQNHSPDAKNLKRMRIFVGGLPPSVTSGSLGKYFEKQFGPVVDSIVILARTDRKKQSRGFGFVTFKEEKSFSAAVQAHYVTMSGKPVEIKGVTPRSAAESEKMLPRKQEPGKNCQSPSPAQMASKEKKMEEHQPEKTSWLGKLLYGQPKASPVIPTAHTDNRPKWIKIFQKWFPGYLQHLPKNPNNGHYALSSLKTDFKAKFGLEMDYRTLGFSKLSDFVKSFSNLCTVKIVPSGKRGSATHMVIQPNPRRRHQLCHTLIMPCSSPLSTSTDDGGDSNGIQDISADDGSDSKCHRDISTDDGGDSKYQDISVDEGSDSKSLQNISIDGGGDSKCLEDISVDVGGGPKSLEDLLINDGGDFGLKHTNSEEEKPSHGDQPKSEKDTSHCVNPTFLQFLKPDPLLNGRKAFDVQDESGCCIVPNKGSSTPRENPGRHLVLEFLARTWNKSLGYFLRDFDFYKKYKDSILEGKCFRCKQNQMVWANSPCQHLLWCSACKVQAIQAAGDFAHKCVVCDAQVNKIVLLPRPDFSPPGSEHVPYHVEFPPIDHGYLQIPYLLY